MEEPVFTTKPGAATTISAKVPYSFECNAKGQPRPDIVWKKDSQLLDRFNNTK